MAILERTFLSNLAERLTPGAGLRVFQQTEEIPTLFHELTDGADADRLFTEGEIHEAAKRATVFKIVYDQWAA